MLLKNSIYAKLPVQLRSGAIWADIPFFAQVRERERCAGNVGSVFFWRDRTREVAFLGEVGGLLELFEAKWTEVPAASDAVNLEFVRNVVRKSRIAGARSSAARQTVIRSPTDFGPCLSPSWVDCRHRGLSVRCPEVGHRNAVQIACKRDKDDSAS